MKPPLVRLADLGFPSLADDLPTLPRVDMALALDDIYRAESDDDSSDAREDIRARYSEARAIVRAYFA